MAKKDFVYYHKDGSIWAKGFMDDGVMEGYWEWFRKPARPAGGDGTKMRSGYFAEASKSVSGLFMTKKVRSIKNAGE